MADAYATQYTLNSTDNVFSTIWKLTRCMKAAGWNVVAHSNGSAKTSAGTNNNDSWGNNADPMADTYPAFDSAAAWIVMQGPKTHKIAIAGPPTGTPVRGEQIIQASSGATGELIGYVWDASTGLGWASVLPRTGSFTGTDSFVGQTSGAGFTASSIKTFVREVVFFKSTNTTSGTCYYICAEQSAESAQLFSTLAASAGATATVAPGAGGTGNAFPALGLCCRGTGGSVGHTAWLANLTSGWSQYAVIAATNAVPGAGVSADGSFYCMVGRGASSTGFLFTRMDDCEPGDIEPYAWFWNTGISSGSWVRTSSSSFGVVNVEDWANFMDSAFPGWKGYLARDCPVTSRDVLTYFYAGYRNVTRNAYFPQFVLGAPASHQMANHPNNVPPFVRDTVSLVSPFRSYKGNARWMMLMAVGSLKDTADGKKWMCVSAFTASNPAVFIGPLDGVSTPV